MAMLPTHGLEANLHGAQMDWQDDPRAFDLTSPSGFAFLVRRGFGPSVSQSLFSCVWLLVICILFNIHAIVQTDQVGVEWSSTLPRRVFGCHGAVLLLFLTNVPWVANNVEFGFCESPHILTEALFLHIGFSRSGNEIRSRHTSGRTILCPYGFCRHGFVRMGNILAVRCILLCMVASWRGLRWLLEHPHGSSIEDLPRFQWMLSVLKVWGWFHVQTRRTIPFLSYLLAYWVIKLHVKVCKWCPTFLDPKFQYQSFGVRMEPPKMLVKFTLIVVSSVFFSAGLGNYILHGKIRRFLTKEAQGLEQWQSHLGNVAPQGWFYVKTATASMFHHQTCSYLFWQEWGQAMCWH